MPVAYCVDGHSQGHSKADAVDGRLFIVHRKDDVTLNQAYRVHEINGKLLAVVDRSFLHDFDRWFAGVKFAVRVAFNPMSQGDE